MAKISVILPVTDEDKAVLFKSLENICGQTHKNIEILCVSQVVSGSVMSILQEFAQKDNRVKLLSYEVKNTAGAKNLALSKATGDYCYFANPHDLIAPTLFEYTDAIFKNFNVDYFCFGSKIIKDEDSKINIQKEQEELIIRQDGLFDLTFDIAKKSNSAIFNKIFKLSIIKDNNISFAEGLKLEDISFIWLYNFVSKKVYMDDCIYQYHKVFDIDKDKQLALAKAYFASFNHMCEQLNGIKGLIEKNYDNLVELLDIYTTKTKSFVKPADKFKVEKLKQESLDKLNEHVLDIERERQRIKQLEQERAITAAEFTLPSITEEDEPAVYTTPKSKKWFSIEPDKSRPNCKILTLFGLEILLRN